VATLAEQALTLYRYKADDDCLVKHRDGINAVKTIDENLRVGPLSNIPAGREDGRESRSMVGSPFGGLYHLGVWERRPTA